MRVLFIIIMALASLPGVGMSNTSVDQTASRRWHEWLKSRTQYPIAVWAYFGKYEGSKEEYQTYADANLTFVSVPISQYQNAVSAGLDVLIGGWEKLHLSPNLLGERIEFSSNSKGRVIGYQLMDEPEPDSFDALSKAVKTIYESDRSGAIPIIDMLPNWAWERNSRRTERYGYHYDDFIDTFVRKVHPPVLLNCHYAPLADGSDRPEYYSNLETFRDHALRNDIGLMAFVLATEITKQYRRPSDSDLRWQVYSALAYGAQGIWYWNWRIKPDTKYGFTEGLVLHDTGEPANGYHLVRAINAEVQAIGGVLMRLQSRHVFHTGDSIPPATMRFPTEGDSGSSAVSRFVGDQFIVGEFRNQDDARDEDAYVMIVNKKHGMNKASTDPDLAATAVFKPCRPFKYVYGYNRRDGRLCLLKSDEGGHYSVTLGGGQGMLLRFSKRG
ncbi:MAG TPA: hypothetical protein VFI02_15535 [Armatimonadota bacterium]|nr:hypothetical protein [Armatimonadota bacterium]